MKLYAYRSTYCIEAGPSLLTERVFVPASYLLRKKMVQQKSTVRQIIFSMRRLILRTYNTYLGSSSLRWPCCQWRHPHRIPWSRFTINDIAAIKTLQIHQLHTENTRDRDQRKNYASTAFGYNYSTVTVVGYFIPATNHYGPSASRTSAWPIILVNIYSTYTSWQWYIIIMAIKSFFIPQIWLVLVCLSLSHFYTLTLFHALLFSFAR